MSLVGRLRLDDVVTSYPELGPTAPDGGYSWVVLLGVVFIQITVPSVLSMYGVVLGYLAKDDVFDFDIWSQKITLTPILFVAFWSLADPWTRTITDLASIPRLVGLIGVALLSTGIIASGYLATGGVGAYLASLSAGAVMGIGASFVIVLSETLVRKHFRVRLPLALALKNIAASFGYTFVPALTHFLLRETGLKTGLLLMTAALIPTAMGTLTLRLPAPQRASPYRLLLSGDEDNELGIRMTPDVAEETNAQDNTAKRDRNATPLFSEVNSIYAFQEDEDVELFVNPRSAGKRWQQEFRVFRYFRFWAALITWIGMRTCSLFFWILMPTLYLKCAPPAYHSDWVILMVVTGFGTFLPSVCSCWLAIATIQYRRIYFGTACWLGSVVLIGLIYANNYYWFLMWSLLGGISINSQLICQDSTLCDVLGNQFALRSRNLFSTFVGLGVLGFCFMRGENVCLEVIALLQFLGGSYWLVPPVWDIIRARRPA
ncbi:PREDICTED: uncharacterized protein LOC106748034 [Dinoponera quadriceps]|uniref:Uncharacterized protein LOC106748034 n=1 Tax=Dinoponera quadriceps TaxID=609295 RepID=A0A6P3XUW6_DINQU|nr:PREDICTED: uncharacterized protein LOC106748034 [Dinoponera quadriceps]